MIQWIAESNATITQFTLVLFEVIMTNSELRASLIMYHLVSQNNCHLVILTKQKDIS